jgi:hypothetical protein
MFANRPLPRRARLLAGAALIAGLAAPALAQRGVQAVPTTASSGTAPNFNIGQANGTGGLTDTVTVNSSELVLDWAPLDTGVGGGAINLLPANNGLAFVGAPGLADYTVLNRIVPVDPTRAVAINGAVTSLVNIAGANVQGGAVWFYTPGGFILGSTARFDVGSLVLSTSPIDTTGGLFGASNTIRFGQAPNPGASIVIQPGAQINVTRPAGSATGTYLAVVAPQITQGGTITADGSVAYVAAEAATVSINAGLFDIAFTTGSGATNPIIHTGTTTGPAALSGRPDNIVVAALAKNTALTMLLGGSIGYSASGATTTDNGAIVLSGGNLTVSSFGASNPSGAAVDLAIGTSNFTSAVTGNASGQITISPDSSGQAVTFGRTASFTGGVGVTASVDAGETLSFDTQSGGLTLAGRATTGAGSNARMTVAAGGTLSGGALAISADGTGSGGTALLDVQGSAIATNVFVTADGIGANGPTGQSGIGGSATVNVTGTAASLAAARLDVTALGVGGRSNDAGAAGALGRGGTAQVTVTGGTLRLDQANGPFALSLAAGGRGGFGFGSSGTGQGGTATARFTDATVTLSEISLDVGGSTNDAVEAGYGFDTTRTGGSTSGGIATFEMTRTDIALSRLGIFADASGGRGSVDANSVAGDGGNATGGTITATLADATLQTSFISASANAEGGDGANGRTGGNGSGGSIAFNGTNSDISAGTAFDLSANGDAGTGDTSGNARGGNAIVTLTGGTLDANETFSLSANGGGFFSFGTPAATAGGTGTGGTAALRMTGVTADLSEIFINADAGGGDSDGVAGAATAGTAELILAGGATVQTFGDVVVSATAEGGSSEVLGGRGGNATGGATTVSITGSSLAVGGDRLLLLSSAIAGFSPGGAAPIARGGDVTLRVLTGGATDPLPSLTALDVQALALGAIANFSEGGDAPGNAGTGVGGRVAVELNGGTVSATTLLLDATGVGGTSFEGGTAGAGYGGRASFTMSGGDVRLTTLDVVGSAFGGLGTEGGDNGVAPGNGGAAGIGTNPFGTDAGAFATVSGGTLNVSSRIGVAARAEGGNGGRGVSSYGDPVVAGSGGGARGGIAFFGSSGTATVDTFFVDVSAEATGGDGGQAEQFASGPRVSTGGAGGAATGGSATLDMGGTIDSPVLTASATGSGGRGGAMVSAFGSPAPAGSTGTAGRGGDGTGGLASLTLSAESGSFVGTYVEANGDGGSGGAGPIGGDGGVGRGGAATLAFDGLGNGRSFSSSSAFAFAQGRGGSGGTSDALAAGNGGDAFGGAARIEVVNGIAASLFGSIAGSSAFGGSGGQGGDSLIGAFVGGGNGGRGGNATGGDSELFVSLASLTLGVGEGSTLGAVSRADGGSGGAGGATSTSGGIGGAGGAGGVALAGTSRLRVEGGTVRSTFYNPDVTARGGDGGIGGTGVAGTGTNGIGGGATGGDIAILVSDIVELGAIGDVSLGLGTLRTAGFAATGAPLPGAAGNITILDDSVGAGALTFSRLTATAGTSTGEGGTISIASRAGPILVGGDTTLTAGDSSDMAFSGTGGLVSTGLVTVNAGGALRIAHSGQAATPAASLGGTDVVLRAGTDLLATGGALIDGSSVFADAATGNLVLAGARSTTSVNAYAAGNASVGRVTATNLLVSAGSSSGGNSVPGANATFTGPVAVSDSITATAPGDIDVAAGAQVVADRRIDFTSGDDIRIAGGARVRAANNAPPETGPGATDPLLQESQLRLVAGGIPAGTRPAGDISSIVIDGTLEAPARTVFLSGQAIAGSAGSVVGGANLFARVTNAPAIGAPASNDGGQLAAGCVEGNVCLGRVLVTNLVRIGETGFVPNALRLVGGIDAVDVLLRTRGTLNLGAVGATDIIRASSSLTIASTGGDILADGNLAVSSGGSLSLAAARDITAPGLTLQAPGTLALFAGRDLTLGALDAAQVQTIDTNGNVIRANGIEAVGAIRITGTARVTNGDLIARAGTGLDLGSVAAAGRNIDLASSTGLVRLGSAGTGTLGTPVNVTLAGPDVALGTVTASGTITATASTGAATLGAVDAGGALTVSARGGITVTGATRGGTIAFTSGDITIANGAQLGSATTSAITLTSNTGTGALGGSEGNGVWRLTDAELNRIRSNGDLTISAPPTGQGGGAFTLIDPASASLLIDGISLSGGQFGANGTLRFSARSIGIVGQANIDGVGSGQTVFLSASQDIALAAETGGIALRDGAGGLAGTLRLEASQVHALTSGARSAAATLDLPALSIRLATQDGIARDGGFFQAGGLTARVARAFFVQNTGATSDVQEDRRGITVGAGGLRVEAIGNAPAAIAINGRILATTGAIRGADVIPATTIAGTLDPQSTINGCLIADPSSCTPSRPRAPIDVALNISRDVITEEVVESAEEAARKGQGSTKLPQVLVEILEVPPRPYDPVIDEPVTGTGNDDLWEQTPSGPPGG